MAQTDKQPEIVLFSELPVVHVSVATRPRECTDRTWPTGTFRGIKVRQSVKVDTPPLGGFE